MGEEFDALARHYHHLQVEHQNAQPESSVRRLTCEVTPSDGKLRGPVDAVAATPPS